MWVPGYSAEVYAPPVGRGGQGCCRAPAHGSVHRGLQWVHGAVMGVRYRVHGEGPYCALDVAGDDGAEVRHPCCAVSAIVYPECVLQRHFGA